MEELTQKLLKNPKYGGKSGRIDQNPIFILWHRQEKYKPITSFYQALG